MGIDFERVAAEAGFALDDAQRSVADRLHRLGTEVAKRRRFGKRPRSVYVWGPVGRGKSWLTTTFFDELDEKHKHRVHFHDFFQQLHEAYSRNRGPRAIDRAVDELLGRTKFLCFDEFHVHDPADAMLIRRLLDSLFARKIVLLTTSNYPPERLLPNPLYHHLFEPTIKMLMAEMDVVELTGGPDYRGVKVDSARTEFETGCYLWPGSDAQLRDAGLEPPEVSEVSELDINGRKIRTLAVRDELVWFDFHDLCDTTTSTMDYLALTGEYSTWVISGVPALNHDSREPAQRFGNVIDVLSDRDIRLVLTGESPLDQLLSGGSLPIDVDRMISRLSLLAVNPDLSRAG